MHTLFIVKPEPITDDCVDWRWKHFKGCLGALDGDARVLRDAINRPYCLKVPLGNYYLCDNGYANSHGFLTPYKGEKCDRTSIRGAKDEMRGEMVVDPLEELIDSWNDRSGVDEETNDATFVDFVEATNDWNMFRDQLASSMWNEHITGGS
ncbi:protein ALP1-like isoform X2 [Salvia divinorum]|uniref:Protein ALP1-like isoform X2 n=1 Tax=Salvia divinorum TaxID=28513 RepID=A0ABD1FKR2_SALDI